MTITAFLEAAKKANEPGVRGDLYQRHYDFAKAARNAAKEIEELVDFARVVVASEEMRDALGIDKAFTPEVVDRIREIVGGGW